MCGLSRAILFAFTLVCLSVPAGADHPSLVSGSGHGGPANTITAGSLPAGSWAVGFSTELTDYDALSDAELAALVEAGAEDVHAVDHILSAAAVIIYGVSETLDLTLRIPWIWRDNIREGEFEDGEAEAHPHGDADGFGDVVLFANYLAWSNRGFDIALQGGIKIPTGNTHEDSAGERLETEFQSGSGSWDFLAGFALAKNFARFSIHSNVLYNVVTNGAQHTDLGDALFYNAALVFSPETTHDHAEHDHAAHAHDSRGHGIRTDLMLEINGEHRGYEHIRDVRQSNSGGDIVYLSPGLRVSLHPWSSFVSFGYPIVDDTNGAQSDVNFRLSGGISMSFD